MANVTKSVNDKTVMNGYDIDHVERILYFGKKFMQLAKQYGTQEYNTFLGLIRDMPTYKIVIRETKKSETEFFIQASCANI